MLDPMAKVGRNLRRATSFLLYPSLPPPQILGGDSNLTRHQLISKMRRNFGLLAAAPGSMMEQYVDALDVNDDGKVKVADFLHIFQPTNKSQSNKSSKEIIDGRARIKDNYTKGEGLVPEEKVRERLKSSLRRIKSTRYHLRAMARVRAFARASFHHDS